MAGEGKVRKGFYIEEDLLEQIDGLLEQADVKSRNEFLNQALKFYIGYLTSEKIENYMLSTISSVMHSTVKDSENRMARVMYKLAVETSKLSHVIAYSHSLSGGGASGLRLDCMCKRPEKRQGLPGNGREKFCGTGRRYGYPDFGGQQNRTEKPCGDCIRRKETGEYDFAGGQ